jgi:hypothetical protein
LFVVGSHPLTIFAPQPVSYVIGPNAGGALIVGRDFWGNKARQDGAAAAFASGNLTLTAPLILLQNNHPGAYARRFGARSRRSALEFC